MSMKVNYLKHKMSETQIINKVWCSTNKTYSDRLMCKRSYLVLPPQILWGMDKKACNLENSGRNNAPVILAPKAWSFFTIYKLSVIRWRQMLLYISNIHNTEIRIWCIYNGAMAYIHRLQMLEGSEHTAQSTHACHYAPNAQSLQVRGTFKQRFNIIFFKEEATVTKFHLCYVLAVFGNCRKYVFIGVIEGNGNGL